MSEFTTHVSKLPPEHEAIRASCFHPTGTFDEFPKEAIELPVQSLLHAPMVAEMTAIMTQKQTKKLGSGRSGSSLGGIGIVVGRRRLRTH